MQAKNEFLRKCKTLRGKCSSIFGITDSSSLRKNPSTIETDSIKKVAYEKYKTENKSIDKALPCRISATQSNISKKNKESSTKVIFLRKCKQERTLNCKTRKIKKKRRKYKFSKNLRKNSSKIKLEGDKPKTCKQNELLQSKNQKTNISDSSDTLFWKEQINCQENRYYKSEKKNLLNKIPLQKSFHDMSPRLISYDENISSTNISAITDYGKKRPFTQYQESQFPIESYNYPCTWNTGPFWVPYQIASSSCPTSEKYEFLQHELIKAEYILNNVNDVPKKRKCSINFIKLLKKGGKIKIPVLFEELCRTENENQALHKLSNISMKFVFVERDRKNYVNPFKKLIKKLSKTKSSHLSEQYVFGVTKCCCDNQIS